MRILGYVGSYNEKIDRTLKALMAQTYPVNHILVVDNASTEPISVPADLTSRVTVIRTDKNIGPSSAVTAGLRYAMQHEYDWMWLIESDGAPHEDAMEKLVTLYQSFPPETRSSIGILSSTQVLLPTPKLYHGRRMTPGGPRFPRIDPLVPYCESDSMNWNGIMFRLRAVRAVGLPRLGKNGYWEDLSYDYGDSEFSYRIRAAGYKVLVHRYSLVDQRVGRSKYTTVFGRVLVSTNHPPFRKYLFFRNLIYFWIHIYPRRNWLLFCTWFFYRFAATMFGMVLLEDQALPKIVASIRGLWDGLYKRLDRKY